MALTIKQEKKKLRVKQWITFAITWVAIVTPISIIFLVNWNKYFVTNPDKVNVTVGAVIALFVLMFAIINGIKAQTKVIKNDDPAKSILVYLKLIFGWALAAIILTLLQSILDDLVMVMWYELIGIVVSAVSYALSTEYKRKADKMKNAIEDEDINYRLKKEREANSDTNIGNMLG